MKSFLVSTVFFALSLVTSLSAFGAVKITCDYPYSYSGGFYVEVVQSTTLSTRFSLTYSRSRGPDGDGASINETTVLVKPTTLRDGDNTFVFDGGQMTFNTVTGHGNITVKDESGSLECKIVERPTEQAVKPVFQCALDNDPEHKPVLSLTFMGPEVVLTNNEGSYRGRGDIQKGYVFTQPILAGLQFQSPLLNVIPAHFQITEMGEPSIVQRLDCK